LNANKLLHQTFQTFWATAITRGYNNNKPSINIIVNFIQMDDKLLKMDETLFNWMEICSIGWRIVQLIKFIHCNLKSIVFGVFVAIFRILASTSSCHKQLVIGFFQLI
jgi:hypothetical protein